MAVAWHSEVDAVKQVPFVESVLIRFFHWCQEQDKNRLVWMGLIFISECCVLTPLTALTIYATGKSFFLFMMVFISMDVTLISSLAFIPTKIILPFYFLNVLIDVCIILCSVTAAVF